jgi:hypothetical protein
MIGALFPISQGEDDGLLLNTSIKSFLAGIHLK